MQKRLSFLQKKCEELLQCQMQCKSSIKFFSKKNITAFNFVSTVGHNKSFTNDFVKDYMSGKFYKFDFFDAVVKDTKRMMLLKTTSKTHVHSKIISIYLI